MDITQMTTPPEQTPQMRYASLHRAIERGMISSTTWAELVQVCLQLGYHEEARKAIENVNDPERRVYFERMMARLHHPEEHGDPSGHHPAAAATPGDSKDAHPKGPARYKRRAHAANGPTEGLGQRAHDASRGPLEEPMREEILDSFRFLFIDHMPLTVIVATLTFPLVLGLGGFLTAGSPFFLFPAIALLPGLSVLGLVGALGRQILLDASKGIDDPPRVPELSVLTREAGRFLRDMAALGPIFLGPAALMMLLDAPIGPTLLSLLVGGGLLPMAMLLRQLTPDWRALSPNVLFSAIVRAGGEYYAAAGVIIGLFVPATIAAFATTGSHLYLQVSVIGPLSVAPLFIAARLLGRVMDRKRDDLLPLLEAETVPRRATALELEEPSAPGMPFQQAEKAATEHLRSLRQRLMRDEAQMVHDREQERQSTDAPPVGSIAEAASRSPAAPNPRPRSAHAPAASAGPRREPAPRTNRPQRRAAAPAATSPLRREPAPPPPTAPVARQRRAQAAPQPRAAQPAAQATPQPRAAQPAAQATPQPAQKRRRAAQPQHPARPQRTAQRPTQHQQPTAEPAWAAQAPAGNDPHIVGDPIPDLTKMPGFCTVSGKEREAVGAAAGCRPRNQLRFRLKH